ncbi:co-chaperone GroES [Candidatus Fermentibacteria bacterium]|nr:co-chaperone GroES [Candidatus Fermentibacteria bacterium]
MSTKVRPLFDRILVKREEPQETVRGGIVLPDTAKEKPLEGTVIAVGEGKRKENGEGFVAPVVKAGDKVLIGKYSGTEVKIDGDEYVIVREDDILAVVDTKKK